MKLPELCLTNSHITRQKGIWLRKKKTVFNCFVAMAELSQCKFNLWYHHKGLCNSVVMISEKKIKHCTFFPTVFRNTSSVASLFIIQKPFNFIFYIFLIYIKIKNIKWYIKYTLRDLTFCEFFTKLVMVRHVFQYVDNKLNILN